MAELKNFKFDPFFTQKSKTYVENCLNERQSHSLTNRFVNESFIERDEKI